MNKVTIVTDGVCDLSQEVIDRYNIVTVPYRIFFGEEVFRIWHNGKSTIPLKEFISKLPSVTKETFPRTSIPSPAEFKEAFDLAFEQSNTVIAVLLTSGMSGAVQAAKTVIDNFFKDKDITIFDSQQTMTGTGILALEAAKMASEGKSKDEIINRLESISVRTRTILAMKDLNFLEKQGRLGPIQNVREKNPDVIPVIHMKDGILQPLTIFHNHEDMENRMLKFINKIIPHIETGEIFITHINNSEATSKLYETLDAIVDREFNIHYYEAGSILGVYSGPDTITISYIGNFDASWL
ncbi:MAG: DegV family protein [Asgard group archaeon]|nr:DegV family protein [Asgard group archaeon]